MVGLYYSDEHETIPPSERSRTPIMFLAARVEHPEDCMKTLEENPPEEWTAGGRWSGGERASIWRPLLPILSALTLEEQREAIASAAAIRRS